MQTVNGEWQYAMYDQFSVDTEADNYQLHLQGYSGSAGRSTAVVFDRNLVRVCRNNYNELKRQKISACQKVVKMAEVKELANVTYVGPGIELVQ